MGSAVPASSTGAAAAPGLRQEEPSKEEVQGRRMKAENSRGLPLQRGAEAGRRAVTPG